MFDSFKGKKNQDFTCRLTKGIGGKKTRVGGLFVVVQVTPWSLRGGGEAREKQQR